MSTSCRKMTAGSILRYFFADGINLEVNTATPCHIDWLFKKKQTLILIYGNIIIFPYKKKIYVFPTTGTCVVLPQNCGAIFP